jgi:hypothetical protein
MPPAPCARAQAASALASAHGTQLPQQARSTAGGAHLRMPNTMKGPPMGYRANSG